MKLTIGYIGFGKSATRYHLPYTLSRPGLLVKTIYTPIRDEVREPEYTRQGIYFTNQITELLNDNEIQLVVVCTPPGTHFELAELCLQHGKHVLVEKPFCPSVAEAITLLKLAAQYGLTVMPFQNRRFDSDFKTVQAVIESGVLGELVEIESHFDYYRPDVSLHPGKDFDGAWYGLGIHMVDQMVALFGRPDTVIYDIRSVRNPESPDDTFEVQLFYGKRLKAIVKTSHLVKIDYPKFIVHGTRGSFVKYGVDQQEASLKAGIMPDDAGFAEEPESHYGSIWYVDEKDVEYSQLVLTLSGDYGCVYDAMYQTIIAGAPQLVDAVELLTTLEILESGFAAASPHIVHLGEM